MEFTEELYRFKDKGIKGHLLLGSVLGVKEKELILYDLKRVEENITLVDATEPKKITMLMQELFKE